MYASGVPKASVSPRLIAVVTRLRRSASRTTGLARAASRPPPNSARATSPMTGTARNRTSGSVRATSPRGRPRGGAHDGGRNPNSLRTACPSGPASQVRNACAAAAFGDAFTTTPAYVAGTLASAGISIVLTFVDAFASVEVDDRRVAFTELDLGDDRLDVVLLRDDVLVVGRREPRRVTPGSGEVRDDLCGVFGDGDVRAGGDDLDAGLGQVGR